MAEDLGHRAAQPGLTHSQLLAAIGIDRAPVEDDEGEPTATTYGVAGITILQAEGDDPSRTVAFCRAVAGGQDPEAAGRQYLHLMSLSPPG
jgi:hypothetical protein